MRIFAIACVETALAISLLASLFHWQLPWTLVPGAVAAMVSFFGFENRIPIVLHGTYLGLGIALSLVGLLFGFVGDPLWMIPDLAASGRSQRG